MSQSNEVKLWQDWNVQVVLDRLQINRSFTDGKPLIKRWSRCRVHVSIYVTCVMFPHKRQRLSLLF